MSGYPKWVAWKQDDAKCAYVYDTQDEAERDAESWAKEQECVVYIAVMTSPRVSFSGKVTREALHAE